jgi:hypothetical protein
MLVINASYSSDIILVCLRAFIKELGQPGYFSFSSCCTLFHIWEQFISTVLEAKGAGIARRYSAGWSEFRFLVGARNFSSHHHIQLVPGDLSLGVKWPGREADHLLHLVLRSGMRGAIPQHPQHAFIAWCSVKRTRGELYHCILEARFLYAVPQN